MEVLPREILVDILALLPGKLVGRCRCVSKSWNHLLSEHDFIRAHLDRTKHLTDNELLLLVSRQFDTVYTASIDRQLPGKVAMFATELTLPVTPKLVSGGTPSCDGLILLKDNAKQTTLLINPTTKKVRVLPVPSHAFDSSKKYAVYGVGYDHITDDYKVVSQFYYLIEDEPVMAVVLVYSVRNDTWKEVDSSLYEPCCVRKGTWKKVESFEYHLGYNMSDSGIFVGGSVNWIATDVSNWSSFIVGFDLVEEKFQVVPAPRSMFGEPYSSFYDIGLLGGCLSVLSLGACEITNIWVMKEYGVGQSWTKISIGDGVSVYGTQLSISTRRELVMALMKDGRAKDMIYDFDSATFKDIEILGSVVHPIFVGCFKETLVSPYYNHETRRA
ncbi:hypothetical protein vseg_005818 [Gypsophila vaccaria]